MGLPIEPGELLGSMVNRGEYAALTVGQKINLSADAPAEFTFAVKHVAAWASMPGTQKRRRTRDLAGRNR